MSTNKTPASTLSLELDPDTIERMVQSHVCAAISAALQSNGKDIAERVVEHSLSVRVGSDGKLLRKGDYQYERAQPWFDHHIHAAIREMAKTALIEWVEAQKPQIYDAFSKAFDRRRPQVLRAMADGTMKALEDKWRFDFKVDISREGSSE